MVNVQTVAGHVNISPELLADSGPPKAFMDMIWDEVGWMSIGVKRVSDDLLPARGRERGSRISRAFANWRER